MNLIKIPLAKSCYLLLTEQEYRRAWLRGKRDRRAQANDRRQRGEGSLAEMLTPRSENREQQRQGGHDAKKK